MTKRLIALLLSLVMMLGCLVGCGEDDAIDDAVTEGSERTITLSMYLVSEEKVSDEQALAIQNAVNKITKSKFKTQLELRYFTEDEYYAALEADFESSLYSDYDDDYFSDVLDGEVTTSAAEETYVDEYGVVQLKYPTITEDHVDIFYVSGYDKLTEYIENEMVQELTNEISSASKTLKTYIYAGYLNGLDTVCNGLYAIPGNAPIGEYTYILINKEILAEYNHTANDFSSILCPNAQYLLDHVSKYNTEYVPLRSFTDSGVLDVSYIRYFGIDENGKFNDDNFSLLGGAYDRKWTYKTPNQLTSCANIFNDSNFTTQLETLVRYKENGYYGTAADADKKFAMGYIKGGYEVYEQYGDEYEIIVHQTPVLDTMDVFENMFAVSANTADLARSMEIITYLYTNKDLHNLLLYGIEGENYEFVDSEELDENGKPYQLVKPLKDNTYVMDSKKLGNSLLANPTVGQNPNLFEIYKQQNLDASISLVMGMMHNFGDKELSMPHAEYLRDFSKTVLNDLLAIEKVEGEGGLNEYIAELRKTLNSDQMLVEAMRYADILIEVEGQEEKLALQTIPAVYNAWVSANKLITAG